MAWAVSSIRSGSGSYNAAVIELSLARMLPSLVELNQITEPPMNEFRAGSRSIARISLVFKGRAIVLKPPSIALADAVIPAIVAGSARERRPIISSLLKVLEEKSRG